MKFYSTLSNLGGAILDIIKKNAIVHIKNKNDIGFFISVVKGDYS